jgi:hypothetical protein
MFYDGGKRFMNKANTSRRSGGQSSSSTPANQAGRRNEKVKNQQPRLLGDLLDTYQLEDKGGFITKEFQDYGYRLACEMGEEKKKGMYIKLAKTVDRAILERARSFVLDAENVNNRGKFFLWAVGKLRKGEPLTEVE